MAREAKFDFQEERLLVQTVRIRRKDQHTATVNVKTGFITFSLSYIRDRGLAGKYVKLYADPAKKAIGWKVLKDEAGHDLANYRQINIYESVDKTSGYKSCTCKLTVKGLLKALNVKEKTYLHMPIKKYNSPLILSENMDYVELKEPDEVE